jgi:hypothetical protein
LRGETRLFFRLDAQNIVRIADALAGSPDEGYADRQHGRCQNQQEFDGSRERSKAPGRFAQHE